MNAITLDFRDILEERKADELSYQIVRDYLDYAQFEPVYVASGGLDSLWANHPSRLLAILSQVREKNRSLITMLNVNVH